MAELSETWKQIKERIDSNLKGRGDTGGVAPSFVDLLLSGAYSGSMHEDLRIYLLECVPSRRCRLSYPWELLDPASISTEALKLYPGIAVVKFGFLPFASDGFGNCAVIHVRTGEIRFADHEYIHEDGFENPDEDACLAPSSDAAREGMELLAPSLREFLLAQLMAPDPEPVPPPPNPRRGLFGTIAKFLGL